VVGQYSYVDATGNEIVVRYSATKDGGFVILNQAELDASVARLTVESAAAAAAANTQRDREEGRLRFKQQQEQQQHRQQQQQQSQLGLPQLNFRANQAARRTQAHTGGQAPEAVDLRTTVVDQKSERRYYRIYLKNTERFDCVLQ